MAITDPIERAQRWHDTDHPDAENGSCWCCCGRCNPEWSSRPNPFWSEAQTQLIAALIH